MFSVHRERLTCRAILALLLGLVAAAARATTVFSTNFDSGAPPQFGGVRTTTGVQGFVGLGPPGDQFGGQLLWNTQSGSNPAPATGLRLTDLPPHTSVSISFLLALMDSWDGTSPFWGPDSFNVRVDGVTVFSQTFSNFFAEEQSYVPPAGVLRTPRPFPNLGFDTTPDSAYWFGAEPSLQNIPHTSSTLTIAWFASGPRYRQESTDESWGIDNVQVSIAPKSDADFDGDGVVDGTDLQAWAGGFGTTPATRRQGDADADLDADGADFLVWQRQVGAGPLESAAIPEPVEIWSLAVVAGAGFRRLRRGGLLASPTGTSTDR